MAYGYLDMLDFKLSKEFSFEEKLTLRIARWLVDNQVAFKVRESLPKDIVWERFRQFLSYHQLSPFAYLFFRKTPYLLPDKEKELLKKSYYSCLINQVYLWQEFIKILDTFNNKGIEFVPIKGIALIIDDIYADKTYLRLMGDIDLLIKEKENLCFVEKTLEDLGYQKYLGGMKEEYWKKKNYHLGFIKNQERKLFYYTEVHWALDYKRDKPILPNLWNRLKKTQVENRNIHLLSPEDTFFCLALHQRRFGKILCLKDICDIAMILNKYGSVFDWDYVLREAKKGKMRTIIYFVLSQVRLLLDKPIPASVISSLGIPQLKKKLIEQFILKETFSANQKLRNANNLFLKCHFLVFDNLWEPVKYILWIPQEQFTKFYRLKPYTRKTCWLYRLRYIYFLYELLLMVSKKIIKSFFKFVVRKPLDYNKNYDKIQNTGRGNVKSE